MASHSELDQKKVNYVDRFARSSVRVYRGVGEIKKKEQEFRKSLRDIYILTEMRNPCTRKKKGTKYHGRYNVNVYLKICNRFVIKHIIKSICGELLKISRI